MAESEVVEQAAAELYGLPPGEFTRARDECAKALRADGDRDAADAVKRLRRPTVAAWAVNQLARQRRGDVDALLAAGERLRAAQEELLGGGDRSAFQEAAAEERDLVGRLSADATTLASEAGERGGGLHEKVAETLHAAALDEEAAEELRRGHLVREREAIGGFGAGGFAGIAAPPRKAASGAAPAKPARTRTPKRAAAQTSRRAEDAARKQQLASARTDERHARRELDAAERAVEHAQERAEAAEKHASEAAERAKTTAARLKEARSAATAARRAHQRATKALEKAESAASSKS